MILANVNIYIYIYVASIIVWCTWGLYILYMYITDLFTSVFHDILDSFVIVFCIV